MRRWKGWWRRGILTGRIWWVPGIWSKWSGRRRIWLWEILGCCMRSIAGLYWRKGSMYIRWLFRTSSNSSTGPNSRPFLDSIKPSAQNRPKSLKSSNRTQNYHPSTVPRPNKLTLFRKKCSNTRTISTNFSKRSQPLTKATLPLPKPLRNT